MTEIVYDKAKNKKLKIQRGINFEDIKEAIGHGGLINIINNPNKIRYPNQKIYIVMLNNYIYGVPYVEDGKRIYLKTVYPSRKFTKLYLKGDKNEK